MWVLNQFLQKKVFKILNNQNGWVSIFIMIIMPIFIAIIMQSMEIPRMIEASNIDLQRTVEQSVKAAAMTVNKESQADGNPYINTAKAYLVFCQLMQDNLKLNADWTPQSDSGVLEVEAYQFYIVNGNNAYSNSPGIYSLPTSVMYNNSSTPITNLTTPDLPYTIGIDETNGLVTAGNGQRETVIKSPSCIGWIKVKMKGYTDNKGEETARWGVGRLVLQ